MFRSALLFLFVSVSLFSCATVPSERPAESQLEIRWSEAVKKEAVSSPTHSNIWEIVTAISAAAGVFISLGGLWIINRQLIQTGGSVKAAGESAEAAAAAARIAFQQSRPWIKLSLNGRHADIHFVEKLDAPHITVPVRYENVGQTPALNHIVVSRGIRDAHEGNGEPILEAWRNILATDWHGQTAVFPAEALEAGYGTVLPWPGDLKTGSFSVLIVCLYKSTVDEPWHATPMVVHLHGPQPSGQPIRRAPGMIFPVTMTSGHDYGLHPI